MKKLHLNPRGFYTLFVLGVMTIAAAAFAGDSEVTRLSEPVAVTATYEVFGTELPDTGTPLSLGDFGKHKLVPPGSLLNVG